MKRLAIVSLILALTPLVIGTALAASNTGIITRYHLNSSSLLPGRYACIQMSPSLPTSGGWACLYDTNRLLDQTHDLMLDALRLKNTCTISWDTVDVSGYAIVSIAECFNP